MSTPHPLGADRWPTMSPAERGQAYSPSSMIGGDLTEVIAAYADGSALTRRLFPPTSHPYGTGPDEVLDLFAPSAPAANPVLHVFLHGGYWQELSRHESAFHLAPLLEAGHWVAVPDYTLAPTASLPAIVDQCVRAVRWCLDDNGGPPARPTRVILSGSSAGAHLAAMVLTVEPRIERAVLFSGIYELTPLVGTYIDDALHLDQATVEHCSPLRWRPARPCPIVVIDGAIEPAEFHAQGDAFATAWQAFGGEITRVTVPERNHFDVPMELSGW